MNFFLITSKFCRELLDIIATPKHQRTENIDTGQILELLIQKDKEIQDAYKTGNFMSLTEKGMLTVKNCYVQVNFDT